MPLVTSVPPEPLRWTLSRGAREFSISTASLGSRLNEAKEAVGEDGCFGTAQIVTALYGDLHRERLRRTREEADEVALKNQITRREYLPRVELERLASDLAGY